MEKRECKYCHEEKDIDQFEVANIIKGKKYLRWKCNTCYVARKSERRREIKKWLEGLKKEMSCRHCGFSDYRAIDMHHDNDDKEFTIGDAYRFGYSKKKILEELEKCTPLCSNCHRILHWEIKEKIKCINEDVEVADI